MTNEEFLRRLEGALKNRVPQEDIDDAMRYHREYFAEAGENAAEELPTPEAVAEQIIQEREEYLRKGKKKVWAKPAVIAALCVGLVAAVAVNWGARSFFRHLWSRSEQEAFASGDVISQVVEGSYGGTSVTTVEKGDRVCLSGTLEPFEAIVVEGVSDHVTITAAGDQFSMDIDHDKKETIDYFIADSTLHITGDLDGMVNLGYEPGNITITVPRSGRWFSQICVDTDMGNIYLADINAREAELDTDLGNITVSGGEFGLLDCDSDKGDVNVSSVTADSLKCYCDVGRVMAMEFLAKEADLEADWGSVEAIAVGAESDYSLELEVDLGEVKVNGQRVSSPYTRYGKERVLEIKADVGSVTLDFADASSIPSPPDPPDPPEVPELSAVFR